jgi:hypothetical protein
MVEVTPRPLNDAPLALGAVAVAGDHERMSVVGQAVERGTARERRRSGHPGRTGAARRHDAERRQQSSLGYVPTRHRFSMLASSFLKSARWRSASRSGSAAMFPYSS